MEITFWMKGSEYQDEQTDMSSSNVWIWRAVESVTHPPRATTITPPICVQMFNDDITAKSPPRPNSFMMESESGA